MPKSTQAFTLIELMAALALLAILTGLAVPAFTQLTQKQRIDSTANELVAHLNLARLHAVTRREITLMCPSDDRIRCSDGNRWDAGWIVFRDPDRNRRIDAESDLLRVGNPARGVTVDSAGRFQVRYRPDGTAGGSNLTLKICDRVDPERARAVIVSNPGRPRVAALPRHLRCPGTG
ncbi:prepilin-type N-terminal cleavage/methylation domain-containing protein [Wenzhouxiangella sp. XN79A]|uniref:GspH/FimT family protein n=1 Tax=Wenzhouxiangella sp. XN79A TaxID=2724193 RepID=UPI00144A9924|nr:GspH/FimT family protein [Wenzhouxiangella sp. XN79A]NKI34829.1 prepilin-type N-terminal cleavage/methylation domain-containing protein [Wenzhouxiangella sp. XN79A]